MRSSIPSSVYGTEGVASAANIPGGRDGAVSWTDSNGNFWLFGGSRVDPIGNLGPRNDLWEYSPTSKEWTWVSGSSTVPGNQKGIYGTQGVAAAANVPGGRSGAVSWIDSSNNLWLFGGAGYDSTGRSGPLNDLWEFNPTTKQWTWVNGSNTIYANAVFGTQGVASAANVPGATANAAYWTDHGGNFWLLSSGDMWEFSPSSKLWTWVNGSSTPNTKGIYGTLGSPSATNVPGSRDVSDSWTDGSGNFWLFGGYGYDGAGSQNALNDLWMYSPTTNQWTWVSGSNLAPGASCLPGVYGTQGTAAAANVPGGRGAANAWIDTNGNLWLFGGLGCDASGTQGELNDLWEFSATNKMWTWQSGSNSVGAPQGGSGGPAGVYGTEGTAAATNTPGGRDGSVSWVDASGNLWLFGGNGHDSTGASGELNDLWSYTP